MVFPKRERWLGICQSKPGQWFLKERYIRGKHWKHYMSGLQLSPQCGIICYQLAQKEEIGEIMTRGINNTISWKKGSPINKLGNFTQQIRSASYMDPLP